MGARGGARARASTLLETFRGKFTYGENAREGGRARARTLMAKLRGNILMAEGAIEDWRARASTRLATRRGSASMAKTRAGAGGQAPARSCNAPRQCPLLRGRARTRAGAREHAPGNTPRQYFYGEGARESGRARASALLATLRGNAPMVKTRIRSDGNMSS